MEREGRSSPHSPGPVVFLVRGGAGSGKSAIGLELLRYFTARGREVRYASGSRAFDASMKHFIRGDEQVSADQFVYFHNFVEPPEPPLDLLICDEAHRLRERSTNRYWPSERQGKQPQVDELIKAARVTVFLLDEDQSVRRDEVGTGGLIERAALRHGVTAQQYALQAEFRCGGSDSYRQWVLDLLGISDESSGVWAPATPMATSRIQLRRAGVYSTGLMPSISFKESEWQGTPLPGHPSAIPKPATRAPSQREGA